MLILCKVGSIFDTDENKIRATTFIVPQIPNFIQIRCRFGDVTYGQIVDTTSSSSCVYE
jgi:hypothetical protein